MNNFCLINFFMWCIWPLGSKKVGCWPKFCLSQGHIFTLLLLFIIFTIVVVAAVIIQGFSSESKGGFSV